MTRSRALAAVPEWRDGLWRRKRAWGHLLLWHAGVPAAVAAPLLRWSVVPAIVTGLVLAAASLGWVRVQHSLALRGSGARPPSGDEGDRLANIAHGTARDLGIPPPRLFVVPTGGPNALVVGGPSPALAVTRSAVETFTRTETEAVVAHCLVRLATGRVDAAARAAAFGRAASRGVGPVGESDDLRTASLTRYPPALQNAIEKAEPRSGRGEPFWFVGEGPSHQSSAERALALADL